MTGRASRWQRIPGPVYVGVALGAVIGGFLGNALCLGYDLWYGPWFPQAGVDPQPAGWAGWWIAGGAMVGAALGFLAAVALLGLGRLGRRSKANADTRHSADSAR